MLLHFLNIRISLLRQRIRQILFFAFLYSAETSVHAAAGMGQILGGIKGIGESIKTMGLVLSGIFFTISGIMFYYNKQRGAEQLSGAILGTVIVALGATLTSIIASYFT